MLASDAVTGSPKATEKSSLIEHSNGMSGGVCWVLLVGVHSRHLEDFDCQLSQASWSGMLFQSWETSCVKTPDGDVVNAPVHDVLGGEGWE